ncbi:hypothetical protein [Fusobacterium necrophorum]|uniref:MORN repeat protein n=1 Tax=Fusobacterium necrophorum TaxID=859 RepID=A0A4Q2KYA5_9FUSO|nr:hypothetical protein [Fusobacterium necrophorum]RXZ68591.1 hypothetical protein EPT53_09260 [Fusobacterium necrophorum]
MANKYKEDQDKWMDGKVEGQFKEYYGDGKAVPKGRYIVGYQDGEMKEFQETRTYTEQGEKEKEESRYIAGYQKGEYEEMQKEKNEVTLSGERIEVEKKEQEEQRRRNENAWVRYAERKKKKEKTINMEREGLE